MYIKFANTSGDVYDHEGSSLNTVYNLGTMLTYDDGIVIVDRDAFQQTTQLEVESIINTLRMALQELYPLQTNKICVFLPRMDSNISKQAEIQAMFAKMTVTGGKSIDYFDIDLVHL